MTADNRALLIIAHGSRATAANEEFLQFVDDLKGQLSGYQSVRGVFLELCQPSLAQGVALEMESGITRFDVYPLFFNCGRHVKRDIPALVENALAEHAPDEINIMTYFGASNQLAAAVNADIKQQKLT